MSFNVSEHVQGEMRLNWKQENIQVIKRTKNVPNIHEKLCTHNWKYYYNHFLQETYPSFFKLDPLSAYKSIHNSVILTICKAWFSSNVAPIADQFL